MLVAKQHHAYPFHRQAVYSATEQPLIWQLGLVGCIFGPCRLKSEQHTNTLVHVQNNLPMRPHKSFQNEACL